MAAGIFIIFYIVRCATVRVMVRLCVRNNKNIHDHNNACINWQFVMALVNGGITEYPQKKWGNQPIYMRPLILASASPRRLALLKQIGVVPDSVQSADINETPLSHETPQACVLRLAKEKAKAIYALHPNAIVLAADTIVVKDNSILGKPLSFMDASSIWKSLSQQQHQVITAVAVISTTIECAVINETWVEFAVIPESIFMDYWQSTEPQDKAGAYAIQGFAARWIKSIKGSYSGVMGLPLYETAEMLEQAGLRILP